MSEQYAPVAEFRGVGVLEREGSVRAMWNGTEYATDGKVYAFFQDDPGTVGVLVFPTERDLKEVLDHHLVGERLLATPDGNRHRLLSRDDCIRFLCRNDPVQMAKALATEPCRTWDEAAGVFIRKGERQPLLEDGPHRHGH